MNETIKENGHQIDVPRLRKALIDWGRLNFRQFPWRCTRDPFQILIAEFMLLRTQAIQAARVFEEFIAHYPSIESIEQSDKERINEILKPLGLKWRADYIWKAVEVLKESFNGMVPESKDDLMKLPGVSQYIAGAVRCFSKGHVEALIDTNTVRVTGRLFGLQTKDSSRRSSKFQGLIETMVDPEQPREYNFALLDLAALICKKRHAPDCPICPLKSICFTGRQVTSSSRIV